MSRRILLSIRADLMAGGALHNPPIIAAPLRRRIQLCVGGALAAILAMPSMALSQVAPLLMPLRTLTHDYPADCCQEKGVWSIAMSPDGQTVASYHEQSVWLWDTRTGKKHRVLDGHQADVRHVAFSPDGNTLASAARDGSVLVWNSKTGQKLRSLEGLKGLVDGFAVANGGKIIGMGREGKIFVWRGDGTVHKEIAFNRRTTMSQAFSADGATAALYQTDGSIQVVSLETGLTLATIDTPGERPVSRALAFSPDGQTLVFGTGAKGTLVARWKLGTDVTQIRSGEWEAPSPIGRFLFSPDSQWLALAVQDLTEGYSTYLLDAHSYEPGAVLEGGTSTMALSFSRDGRMLAGASGGEKKVHLWPTPSGMSAELKAHWARYGSNLARATIRNSSVPGSRDGLTFHPDGSSLAGTSFHHLFMWDVNARVLKLEQEQKNGNFVPITNTRAQFLPDGKTLTTFTSDRAARFLDGAGTKVRYLAAPSGEREGLAGFAPGIYGSAYVLPIAKYASYTGQGLMSVSNHDGYDTFEVRRTGTNELLNRFVKRDGTEGEWLLGFAFDDKKNLIYGCNGSGVVVLDAASGSQQAHFSQKDTIGDRCTLELSNDGKWLIQTAASQQFCAVWETATGKNLIRVQMAGTDAKVQAAALSADGKTLLCGSLGDNSVSVTAAAYDVGSAKRLWSIPGYIIGGVGSLAIHPNGRTFAAGGYGKVSFWDVATGQPAAPR